MGSRRPLYHSFADGRDWRATAARYSRQPVVERTADAGFERIEIAAGDRFGARPDRLVAVAVRTP